MTGNLLAGCATVVASAGDGWVWVLIGLFILAAIILAIRKGGGGRGSGCAFGCGGGGGDSGCGGGCGGGCGS